MNRQELINYLQANEIWAKRSMGQNFLVDDEALKKIIVGAELTPADTVLEIGPGLGVLTEELSKAAGRVIAIEKDSKLAGKLKSEIRNPNVKIIEMDALDFDPKNYQLADGSYKLVANIPYNITSLIIRKFLENPIKPSLMILMVQKEVGERIVAGPGNMSLLAVSVQFYADPVIIAIIPRESFFPIPKVDSAIIKLVSRSASKQVSKTEEKDFFRIVKFGFASKRKTLENNLSAGMHIKKEDSRDIIRKAGLEAKIRAEGLGVGEWTKLFEIITKAEKQKSD
jgi:16S rRNA (adenine1518-N6/adenine1519-N6)-dimethyltransferase